MSKIFYFLPFLFLLAACSDSEDQTRDAEFRLASENPYVSVSGNGRYATINTPGYDAEYLLYISGEFANIVFNTDVDWLAAEYSAGYITIHTKALNDNGIESRTGKVTFTIFNDSKSASGYISVTQRATTYGDLRAKEDDAINYFLSQQNLITQLPADNNFQTGDNAPFYLLSDNPIVAMRVMDKGTDTKPADNERVYFRFSRANLLTYYQTGNLEENWKPGLSDSNCYFILNDFSTTRSAQWGKAIQMPLLYGLGYNAKVHLVVPSPFGLTQEIANVTPFLYTISYYKG